MSFGLELEIIPFKYKAKFTLKMKGQNIWLFVFIPILLFIYFSLFLLLLNYYTIVILKQMFSARGDTM